MLATSTYLRKTADGRYEFGTVTRAKNFRKQADVYVPAGTADTVAAAEAMGYRGWQRLLLVELPVAVPVIASLNWFFYRLQELSFKWLRLFNQPNAARVVLVIQEKIKC